MEAVRVVAAVVGVGIVLLVSLSIGRTLIIPRARLGRYEKAVDRVIDSGYLLAVSRIRDYARRDSILATQASTYLVVILAAWLVSYLAGFALVIWPSSRDIGIAFEESGSSMLTLGFVSPGSGASTALDVIEAGFGLVVVALQIAYLPTLYAAFNRRETEVTLLGARAGTPPWGPELLARTRWGINGDRDDLPQLYATWERWAADVAETHSNYPVLIRFRSPRPLSSWMVGMLAVLDSAALLLSLTPSRPRLEARLCLRMGFLAFQQIGDALGFPRLDDPSAEDDIELTFEEFKSAVESLVDVGFEVEVSAEEAWPHFKGWRVNYESVAYRLTYGTDAVPALWSGPRRWAAEQIPPRRPPNRVPSGGAPPGYKRPKTLLSPPEPEPRAPGRHDGDAAQRGGDGVAARDGDASPPRDLDGVAARDERVGRES